ncbi:MAG: trehalose-phosphatase [Nitrospira sp.]|nr:MAG: trehalose-phosphatase [Nitrospira sp.]
MMYLLSPEGREAMRVVAGGPILYAFDFDGTLAKISPDRESVKLTRSIHEWLVELAKRAPCAVISGRALSDLAPRVNGAVPYLIGNHGLESPLTPSVTLLWADGICAGWRAAIKGELAPQLADLGIDVEDKRYSLTLHYREREEEDSIRPILLTLLSRLGPAPRLIIGKQSINLLPPGKGGKGAAALALMRHLRQPGFFFIGDDETDEDVFALTEGLAMGVRVGPRAGSRAKFYIKHQGEIEDVLRFLIHRLDRTPEQGQHADRPAMTHRKEAEHDG